MKTPITVKDLIQTLLKYPANAPVYTAWEGQVIPLTKGCVLLNPPAGRLPEHVEIYAEDI